MKTEKVGKKKRNNNSDGMQLFLVITLHGTHNLHILLSLLQVEY